MSRWESIDTVLINGNLAPLIEQSRILWMMGERATAQARVQFVIDENVGNKTVI